MKRLIPVASSETLSDKTVISKISELMAVILSCWIQSSVGAPPRDCLKSHNIGENIQKRSGVGVGFEQNTLEKIPLRQHHTPSARAQG
jgi:hypothetical protein